MEFIEKEIKYQHLKKYLETLKDEYLKLMDIKYPMNEVGCRRRLDEFEEKRWLALTNILGPLERKVKQYEKELLNAALIEIGELPIE
jgi:hypothetical protein